MSLSAKCALVAVGLCASVATLHAAPVNGTGNVTPDIIFGSGNGNGGFTGETANNIEVGLRGKQRYPAANIFNYDGVDTYTFVNSGTNPANRSVFNFEWSVNVNQDGFGTGMLGDFSYALGVDTDPTSGVNLVFLDPFNTPGYFDHALGNNMTANGAGIESADNADLVANMASYSVAQQSSNLGFGFSADPDLAGLYTFSFSVFEKGTLNLLASSTINVAVTEVPEPGTLSLMLGALGVLGYASRRRAKRQG